jgi:ketosteroid isomerase-like protein
VTPAEKLALAQRAYAAFSPLDIDAIIPLYHPECEWRMAPGREVFGADAFRGHEGLRAFVAFIGEASDSYAAEIDEARITPEGALLVSNTTHARSSGAARMELSARGWQALEFRDGLILSIVQFGGTPPGWAEAIPVLSPGPTP